MTQTDNRHNSGSCGVDIYHPCMDLDEIMRKINLVSIGDYEYHPPGATIYDAIKDSPHFYILMRQIVQPTMWILQGEMLRRGKSKWIRGRTRDQKVIRYQKGDWNWILPHTCCVFKYGKTNIRSDRPEIYTLCRKISDFSMEIRYYDGCGDDDDGSYFILRNNNNVTLIGGYVTKDLLVYNFNDVEIDLLHYPNPYEYWTPVIHDTINDLTNKHNLRKFGEQYTSWYDALRYFMYTI